MDKIYLKARAKINLSLEVLNKREDNYHNIKSIFQKINLYDEIYIEKNDSNKFELITNIDSINNKENIIYKAYIKIKEKYSINTGINVKLNKKIPMLAGLGGGSTDCASFIIGINKLFNLRLSKFEMEALGRSLGADVVPCFYNQAILAEGIGDIITTVGTNLKYYIVVIKPNLCCNTKEMYNLIDNRKEITNLNVADNITIGLKQKDINLIANNLYNTFECVQFDKILIQKLKRELIENGAIGSLMTGSGSCVYGIFDNKQTSKKAYDKLKGKYKTFICTSYNSKRIFG